MFVTVRRQWVRRVVLAVGIGLVLGAVFTIAMVLRSGTGNGPGLATQSTGIVDDGADLAERSRIDDVQRMLGDLPRAVAAGDGSRWLDESVRIQADRLAHVWPPGSVTVIDHPSWRRTGTVASFDAVVTTAGQSREYRVIVVRDARGWLILEVTPVGV